MRDRERDKREVALSGSTRATALSLIDSWADLAERKDTEAAGAYLILGERTAQLKAMTEARDLCKRQTADLEARYQRLARAARAMLDRNPGVGARPEAFLIRAALGDDAAARLCQEHGYEA